MVVLISWRDCLCVSLVMFAAHAFVTEYCVLELFLSFYIVIPISMLGRYTASGKPLNEAAIE